MVVFAHGGVFGEGAEGVHVRACVGEGVLASCLASCVDGFYFVFGGCCCLDRGEFNECLSVGRQLGFAFAERL